MQRMDQGYSWIWQQKMDTGKHEWGTRLPPKPGNVSAVVLQYSASPAYRQ